MGSGKFAGLSFTRGVSWSDTSRARMSDFAAIVDLMKRSYHLRIRRWRKAMSGCAWRVSHHDGRAVNFIEAPYPRTPLSLSIFLHEVGHHAIGFSRFAKGCEEEYHVWRWALKQMEKLGVAADAKVARRFEMSMRYAVGKATRRGIKELPEPLAQFLPQAA
jgi:hypothetical protein